MASSLTPSHKHTLSPGGTRAFAHKVSFSSNRTSIVSSVSYNRIICASGFAAQMNVDPRLSHHTFLEMKNVTASSVFSSSGIFSSKLRLFLSICSSINWYLLFGAENRGVIVLAESSTGGPVTHVLISLNFWSVDSTSDPPRKSSTFVCNWMRCRVRGWFRGGIHRDVREPAKLAHCLPRKELAGCL